MPTPTNYNNIAYARQYKAINVVDDNKAYDGVEMAVKGSIDLSSDKGTNQSEGFFTHHTTASVSSQAEVSDDNNSMCVPYSFGWMK